MNTLYLFTLVFLQQGMYLGPNMHTRVSNFIHASTVKLAAPVVLICFFFVSTYCIAYQPANFDLCILLWLAKALVDTEQISATIKKTYRLKA